MTALDAWCETHGGTYSARWEFEQVIHLATRFDQWPQVILELGTHEGASLAVWIEEFRPEVVIGVEAERSARIFNGLTENLHGSCARIVVGKTDEPRVFNEVVERLEGKWVDFLYIDADHGLEQVRSDFLMYAPLVRDGGLIVLDDAVTKGVTGTEVYRLVPELQGRGPTALLYGGGDSGGKLVVFR